MLPRFSLVNITYLAPVSQAFISQYVHNSYNSFTDSQRPVLFVPSQQMRFFSMYSLLVIFISPFQYSGSII